MSEYAKIDGIEVKIGTCENMRYIRYDEVDRCRAMPGSITAAEMKKHRGKLAFRFPFPSEDNAKGEDIAKRGMSDSPVVIRMPFALPEGHHKSATIACGDRGMGRGGAYNVNMKVPCPCSEEGRKMTISKEPDGTIARIDSEWFIDGEWVTMFRCAYCEALFYLDKGEVEEVREWYAKTYRDNPYAETLARVKGATEEAEKVS
jgi:hypothetical protein